MQEYTVDVSKVKSWDEFIAAFNDGFIRPNTGEWNGNLNALNDYLYWPDEKPYRLIVKGWTDAVSALSKHQTPDYRPVLEEITEIFRDNKYGEVVLN